MSESFVAQLEEQFQVSLEGVPLLPRAIREKAWESFRSKGLPQKKLPGYQYLPFTSLYAESFFLTKETDIAHEYISQRIYNDSEETYVAFVNGQYVPELSNISGLPNEVVVLRLRDALEKYGSYLQGRLSRSIKDDTDPFATLNLALIQMGLFVYIPPHVQLENPIQCVHFITNERPYLLNPRIHFFLGKQAKADFIAETYCLHDHSYFNNHVIDVALEEGAHFAQYSLLNSAGEGWTFDATRATLKRDSHFKTWSLTPGSQSVRQDIRVALLEENATCDLQGIALLSGNRQAHTNIHVEHHAPHCQSNQLFKSVLNDNSRSSFEGKIYVHPEAQKTEAYQLNNNLLLSDRAMANSKPNLEIFADDVKASHGATVTQVNLEHLFYLTSRGVPPAKAKKLLLTGFGLDIIQAIPFSPVKERMSRLVEKFIL